MIKSTQPSSPTVTDRIATLPTGASPKSTLGSLIDGSHDIKGWTNSSSGQSSEAERSTGWQRKGPRVRVRRRGCIRGLHCANERGRVRGLVCVDPAGEKMHRRSVAGCEWDSCVGQNRRSLCVPPIKICDQLSVSVPQVKFLETFLKSTWTGGGEEFGVRKAQMVGFSFNTFPMFCLDGKFVALVEFKLTGIRNVCCHVQILVFETSTISYL